MKQKAHPIFLQCETGLHAGSGSELGIIDLPIQRERHTGFPKIEGSSLKGSLREHFEGIHNNGKIEPLISATFGTDTDVSGDSSQAGAIGITDARLLLFPVKSVKGVFAYITCPRVLYKFSYDMNLCEGNILKDLEIPTKNTFSPGNSLMLANQQVVLEQYTYKLTEDERVKRFGEWLAAQLFESESDSYWAQKLKKDIVVLPDDDFRDFVMLSTEVITRIKIDNETGTVAKGALFTEEYLPAESILYSLILTRGEFHTALTLKDKSQRKSEEEIRAFFANTFSTPENQIFQLGGSATLGKGILKATFIDSSKS